MGLNVAEGRLAPIEVLGGLFLYAPPAPLETKREVCNVTPKRSAYTEVSEAQADGHLRAARDRAVILQRPAGLRFGDWCRLNGLSERTGRRIFAGPNGPVVTKLSTKIFDITVAANRAWQQSRARG